MKKFPTLLVALLIGLPLWAQEEPVGTGENRTQNERTEGYRAAQRARFEQFEQQFGQATYTHKGLEVPYRTRHIAPTMGGREALVIYLHDSKGTGLDNRAQLRGEGAQIVVRNLEKLGQKLLFVAPQCRPDRRWNESYATLGDKMPVVLKGLIDRVLAENPEVDPARIYLIGDSSGGSGVLFMLDNYPKLFAGANAAACYPHKSNSAAAAAKTPLAISFSDYRPERQAMTKEFAEKVSRKGGTVRFIPLTGYDNNGARFSEELLQWMLSQRR